MKARVTGRVQGVAFRAWTRSRADRLGLSGWVCNEDNGSVSALFDGQKGAVLAMIDELWEGPGAASVLDVQTEMVPHDDALSGFYIRY
ncbi:Acylphosphatase [Thalassovita gelatinovora]|uniref:acylphosphatase n=2 Tax=Thalassovita gelatinovora TaxID=53501 RepID=A0A0N7LVC7_THAGE|nr:Acylphosphatase [Thalassovita gelatinovora]SEQ73913.1 acylphosphatase [Thalassovita gelatinovora]